MPESDRDITILGIGTAQPVHSIDQLGAISFATAAGAAQPEQVRALQTLYRRTGIERRGSVVLDESEGEWARQTFFRPSTGTCDRGPTSAERIELYSIKAAPLALHASRLALESAGVEASAVAHLVTASCTGYTAPGFDSALIEQLPLSPDVSRTHVGFMGCHAALNSLRVAAALAKIDTRGPALVCAVELCSLHFQYGAEPGNSVSNALFADGAAAVVCGPAASSPAGWRLTRSGSHLFPNSQDAMSWRIGNHGFEMYLSPRVPQLIASQLRPWLATWLERAGLTLPDLGSWAIHPGGPRILDTISSALGLPREATSVSREILAQCGNMSSPTILFILKELMRRGAPRPCVALGFGPGLAVEAALFK